MPQVHIEGGVFGPTVVSEEPSGGRLVDICDDTQAAVPFSCRGASCGTCRVDILEGADLVDPPDANEREILELFGDPPARRLACVVRVRPGSGRLRLRVEDDPT
jgi:ferredoxin